MGRKEKYGPPQVRSAVLMQSSEDEAPTRLTGPAIHDDCMSSRGTGFGMFRLPPLAFDDCGLSMKNVLMFFERGRPGFDGDDEAKVAGRGAGRSSLKPSIHIIANDNYDYAMAA